LDATNDTILEIDKEFILLTYALALFEQTAADPWLESDKEIASNLVTN
jgi:hypothetical protein